MKKWIYIGSVLLVVQLGLVLLIHSGSRKLEAFTPQGNLLSFAPHEIDSLKIFGEADEEVILNKINGKWFFPDAKFKAPADNKKIEELLEKLASLKQGLAVATTKGAAKRFEVSVDEFKRHVVLNEGEQIVADLYLGTSPSFKMVHARVDGHDEVFSVALNTFDFETDYDKWLDRNITKVEKDKISGVSFGDIQLSKKDNLWILSDIAENEKVENTKIDELVNKISNITVDGIVTPKDDEMMSNEASLYLTLSLSDGNTKTYAFSKREESNHYVLKFSDYDFFLKVNTWTVDEIKKVERISVVSAKADLQDTTKDKTQ